MFGTVSERTRRRLAESGVRAVALVEEIADEGALVPDPDEPQVVLVTRLRVSSPNGTAPFVVSRRFRYPLDDVPIAGDQLNVVYDPGRHSRMILDGAHGPDGPA